MVKTTNQFRLVSYSDFSQIHICGWVSKPIIIYYYYVWENNPPFSSYLGYHI